MNSTLRFAAILAIILILAVPFSAVMAETTAEVPAEMANYTGPWIDVDLSNLRATAFEGNQAVYAAPITSGKPGYETPIGVHYISTRIASQVSPASFLELVFVFIPVDRIELQGGIQAL
jgi:hypothetical protein